ncbi:coiled-coil domain-containing protein 22 homolog [Corticium candelabrum]|uniref:coiled-coil domain-containing protein 22 homolog n=1 Tax=Corticium candelabrum TaxID=121492 RepID=UPI002E26F810|nr:coiled-coil domain-containing protein 22 homolog [Corticium candelabrum]
MSGLDEVDNIIIVTLRQIGCDFLEDVASLASFTAEIVVSAVSRCLKVISDDLDLPKKLPSNMSARFRVGTDLANACKDLGYRSDIGYQTFLYPNNADLRKLFMFLVEKLPKESAAAADEPVGSYAMLNRAIAAEVSRRLSLGWTPSYCKLARLAWSGGAPRQWHYEGTSGMHSFHADLLTVPTGLGDITVNVPKEMRRFYGSPYLKLVTLQPPQAHNVVASILEHNASELTSSQEWEAEWNQAGLASHLPPDEYRDKKRQRIKKRVADQLRASAKQASGSSVGSDLAQLIGSFAGRESALGKGSRFTHTEKLQFAKDDVTVDTGPRVETEEELKKKREDEVAALQARLEDLTVQLEKMEMDIKKFTTNTSRMQEMTVSIRASFKDEEDAYRVKKQTMDMLPEADKHIAELQKLIDASAKRLVTLSQQWESHRGPLIAKYRELKSLNDLRMNESAQRLEEIRAIREKIRELTAEGRSKDNLHKQLVGEYERMGKDVGRASYTRRILEIVGNIRKQRADIDKVLVDTRALQKEINLQSGKLDRIFTITDEQIFMNVKKDEACRKAYKYLASMHESCGILITSVEETGNVMREIRELEDQIESEKQKKLDDSFGQISADLKQMKQENATLVAKIKSK